MVRVFITFSSEGCLGSSNAWWSPLSNEPVGMETILYPLGTGKETEAEAAGDVEVAETVADEVDG